MKTGSISLLVLVLGSALLLAATFVAQGSEVHAANQSFSSVLSTSNTGDFVQTVQSPARLDHTAAITFTPAFTIHLPLTMKNLGVYGCYPGQTVVDPEMDVSIAHIDVTALSSTLNGETLQATFDIRDVPPTLTFNRIGVPQNYGEYSWAVYVDIDDNPQTGSPREERKGAEYELTAFHSVVTPDSPVDLAIEVGVKVYICQYNPTDEHFHCSVNGTISVDSQLDTITLTGNIPGINSGSRLFFYTLDYNPGGTTERDESSCSVVTGEESR